jgi:T-complex protein 1 subunit zeta
MQIQHPTASMIARAATAQGLISLQLTYLDDIVGDGTTSNVLFIGELLRQAERYLGQAIHPRILVDGKIHLHSNYLGMELAKNRALEYLEKCKRTPEITKEVLMKVAESSLMTKLNKRIANQLVEIIVDSVLTIKRDDKPIDLFMVELMHMKHKMATETCLVRGLVLDHGARHPDMPKKLKNCYIMTCNVSLEYEKTEVHSGFFWKDAESREKLIKSERAFTDDKVAKVIALKRKVCDTPDKSFVIINQKGIDPISLDMLQKENIIGLRRAKRRNMERLTLMCGGNALNSVDDMSIEDLGYAESVYEHELGEEKYTFVEGVKHKEKSSCTILIKGPNDHTIAQIKDGVRDGLRAVKNAIMDQAVLAGAGAFEVGAHLDLKQYMKEVEGKTKLGIQAFADALLVVPRTLAENSGLDTEDVILKVLDAQEKESDGKPAVFGVDVEKGEPFAAELAGVYDNYIVKKQFLNIAPVLAQQLLLVDEVMRAGKQMGGH